MAPAVASLSPVRQQMDVDALGLQGADGLDGRRLDAVGNGDDGQGLHLVGKPDDRLCFRFPRRGGFLQGGGDVFALHQAAIACIVVHPLINSLHALSRQTFKVIYI